MLAELNAQSSNRKSSARAAALLDARRACLRLFAAPPRRLLEGFGFACDRRTKLFIAHDVMCEGPSRWPANCALIQSTGISLTMMAYRCGPQSCSALSLEPRRPR